MKKQFRITLNGKSYDVEAEILAERTEHRLIEVGGDECVHSY